MPALVAGIHVFSLIAAKQGVDGRDISAFTRVHSPSKTGVDAFLGHALPSHDDAESQSNTMENG
jgi:hypothetical protein